jgi:hypothetical protein
VCCSEDVALSSDDAHVWCTKHVEAIKLHGLSPLVGSLPFTMYAAVMLCYHVASLRVTDPVFSSE